MNTTGPSRRLSRLLRKSLTVAVATSALIGLGTSQASADVTTRNGGFAHTDATCHSVQNLIHLNVEMGAEREYPYGEQQTGQFRAYFWRYNDSTRRWDYKNYWTSQPFYIGWSQQLQDVSLSDGFWYIQMEYKWYRGEFGQAPNKVAETLTQYMQDNNTYYGSQTRVYNYCRL